MKIKDDSFFKSVRAFLTIYLPRQRRLSANTVTSYKTALNQFVDFMVCECGKPITKITFDDFTAENVNAYLDWLQESRKCGGTTRNQRLMALRSFAYYSSITDVANVRVKLDIDSVPFQKTPGKIVDHLSMDAMKTLLALPDMKNHWGIRNGFFMILMYDTAARCQELIELKLRDFVLDQGTPYVCLTGKGDKSRTVPLMEKTVEHLHRYLYFFHPVDTRCADDHLFYTVSHGHRHHMSADTVARFIRDYGREAHKNNSAVPPHVHPQQFRHSRAIHLYRSGVPLPLLAEYLGHANVTATSIYAFADTDMKNDARRKANRGNKAAIWESDEDMVKRLYCMK
jgi:site-specific recombinase XerD